MGFQYDQNSAMKAGGTAKETGAYVGHIATAEYKRANTGSAGLELSFKTQDGSEFNYIKLWYQKADGTEIKGGSSMINAIMGLTNVQQLSEKQVGVDQQTQKPIFTAPELIGKDVGLLLQKVWYTKDDGSDGYKFEIRLPFNPGTKQTLKEQINNAPAEMLNRMLSTMKDKDDRNQNGAPNTGSLGNHQGGFAGQQQGGFNNPPPAPQQPQGGGFDDFDDDVGF